MKLLNIEDYLENVFKERVKIHKYSKTKKLPLFLQNEYEFFECEIQGVHCVLMKLLTERILIEKLIKHFNKLREFGVETPILIFDDLRSNQRNILVANRIALIVPGKQIYLPFICLDFNEIIKLKQPIIKKFTAGMQSVFLYIIYNKKEVITGEIAKELKISTASANRAIRQFVALGLVAESGHTTRKRYIRIPKREYWEKGKNHLINPVQKIIYLSEIPKNLKVYFSYDSALSKMSMLNEPANEIYAVNKKCFTGISSEYILDNEILDGKEYYKVEVWKYNPELFARDGSVDVFSLFAEYIEEDDPRVEIELENILKEALCED